jgi:hypothetical protein
MWSIWGKERGTCVEVLKAMTDARNAPSGFFAGETKRSDENLTQGKQSLLWCARGVKGALETKGSDLWKDFGRTLEGDGDLDKGLGGCSSMLEPIVAYACLVVFARDRRAEPAIFDCAHFHV